MKTEGREQKAEDRRHYSQVSAFCLLSCVFWFLTPASAHALAYIVIMDPGFVTHVLLTVPLAAALGIALLETALFRPLRKQRGSVALFGALFMGAAIGMAWAALLFVAVFFLVSEPLTRGPEWLSWAAYWYFAGIHAYLLVLAMRWTARTLVKGLDLTLVRRRLWIASALGCLALYLFLYLDLFYGA